MKLKIHDKILITDLQKEFSKGFPGLKIEWYANGSRICLACCEHHGVSCKRKLSEVRSDHREGEIEIEHWHTVGHVKRTFAAFGLHVQVFRSENGSWIQKHEHETCQL